MKPQGCHGWLPSQDMIPEQKSKESKSSKFESDHL